MWEINIKTSQNNSNYILKILNEIQPCLKKHNAVFAVDNNNNSLSIGCEQKKAKSLWNNVKIALCNIFCFEMKKHFLSQHINLEQMPKPCKDAFLNVLTYFDSDLERKLVFRLLSYSKNLVLESYLNFKLQPLKKKWAELCVLSNSNSSILLKEQSFMELLKFLISSIEPKNSCAVVCFRSPCVVFKDEQKNVVTVDAFEQSDAFSVVSQLIEIAPKQIKVVLDTKQNPTFNVLNELFSGKIELIEA